MYKNQNCIIMYPFSKRRKNLRMVTSRIKIIMWSKFKVPNKPSQTDFLFDSSLCITTLIYKDFLHLCHQLYLEVGEPSSGKFSLYISNILVLRKCNDFLLPSKSLYREYNIRYGDIPILLRVLVIPYIHK